MDLKNILDSFAGYINFAITFLQWGGMNAFHRAGEVAATPVTYCLTGIFLAWVITFRWKSAVKPFRRFGFLVFDLRREQRTYPRSSEDDRAVTV